MNALKRLEQLLSLTTENEVVEFKEAKNQYDLKKLGKYYSALSNEANLANQKHAWLVFGVKDNRSVVGSSFRLDAKALESLKKEIADKVSNRLTFIGIHELKHAAGRVLLFQIPAAPKGIPVAWEWHYYGRDGESLVPLNLEEIERIRAQNQTYDWSAEVLLEASLDDLDPSAIAQARDRFAQKNPKLVGDLKDWDTATFLNKAKLTINGQVTRAAILLLGKPESSHLLNPASATITWILKDRDGIERDYEHFTCPLLLSANEVFQKVRNLKYRYMVEGNLFPEEVDQYDPYIIREALNNAIAHQDYELGGKVTLVEFEDGRLCFSNQGDFIPGTVESVVSDDAPESRYRNRYLSDAMVNLNMIDTIGSGIRKMFLIQKNRFFPLPEYKLSNNRVEVTITGGVLDMAYARKLAMYPDLSLEDIILLDRVQKQQSLTDTQAKYLKSEGLIEGRKPNYHISAKLAKHSNDKASYIRTRGLDDQHYKQMILGYLEQFGMGKRSEFDELLLDKLPDVLDRDQKNHKIRNLLQSMKREGLIEPEGKSWRLPK